MAQPIQQIISAAPASPHMDGAGLFRIVESAASYTSEHDITGVLVFAGKHFYSALEGEPNEIGLLLNVASNDGRFGTPRILRETQLEVRQFEGWRMKRLAIHDADLAQREFKRLMTRHRNARRVLEEFERFIDMKRALAA
ncbi:BLUF domain-containing protein [Qipengyuania sp. DGS5-3]|uniref:BLUF domain-containing protein n=1 Tax=Qipengyuania sp. DGS5-3 TaxID=3349632 RepID=UPI0036D2493F